MSHALRIDTPDDEVEVWSPSPDEWSAYVRAGLERLRITYDELARQARERDFQSTEAMNFWIVVGGQTA